MGRSRWCLPSQQQLLEIRGCAAHAALSHPGKWLDVGENGYLTNTYLADVCAAAQAKLLCRMPPAAQIGIRTISRSCSANGIPPAQRC